jgi:type II secretory pathway component PulF
MFGTREARRAAVYRQLGALETAGIPLATAVNKVIDPNVAIASKLLDDGEDPGTAWERAQFSPLEIALVKAGAKGGTLAGTFKELEKIFEDRASQARRLLVVLAYPVGLFHLALLIPKLYVLVQSGLYAYLKVSFLPLVSAWAIFFGAIVVIRAARAAQPALVDTIWVSIPAFGGLVRRRAIAHAIHVLAALYKSGVPVRDAVDAARDAATVWPVKQAFTRIAERLDKGLSLGDAFLQEESLPTEVRESAGTGAATGQLDETLAGAERRLNEEAQTRQALILTATPVLLFLFVAAMIGWTVISMWTDVLGKMDALGK